MSFRLPVFNLDVNIYRHGHAPPYTPPDVTAKGNLAASWRGPSFQWSDNDDEDWGMWAQYRLLLPKNTDIQVALFTTGAVLAGDNDWVEVPAGSGQYFFVRGIFVAGAGFANEHLVAIINQTLPFIQPSAVVY
jgi:hypothetical protein